MSLYCVTHFVAVSADAAERETDKLVAELARSEPLEKSKRVPRPTVMRGHPASSKELANALKTKPPVPTSQAVKKKTIDTTKRSFNRHKRTAEQMLDDQASAARNLFGEDSDSSASPEKQTLKRTPKKTSKPTPTKSASPENTPLRPSHNSARKSSFSKKLLQSGSSGMSPLKPASSPSAKELQSTRVTSPTKRSTSSSCGCRILHKHSTLTNRLV